jgi:hypothetical protein
MGDERFKELWQLHFSEQPDAAVMPCSCGCMPAPVTMISMTRRRRCLECYTTEMSIALNGWYKA